MQEQYLHVPGSNYYHRSTCRLVNHYYHTTYRIKNQHLYIPITLADIYYKGLLPCTLCKPPIIAKTDENF